MNFSGNVDARLSHSVPASADGETFNFDSKPGFVLNHDSSSAVVIPDAHLLFSGDYKRIGNDLIISNSDQKFVVGNYFKGESRPSLATKDGATLSGSIVDAMTGHVMYAQAAAPAGAAVCGHVMKMTGSASVIRNGVSVELHIGDAIQKGDVVQTGSDSSIGMTLVDGSAFGMTSNARMVINEMIYDPNGSSNSSLISLVQGTITFVAGQTAKNGNMRVDTPVATMGIRGTAVLVEISANDGPTKFSVLVEPDGHTGSYNLYDKSTGQLLGTVSQSGQVTFVTSTGLGLPAMATEQPKTLQDQQHEKALIQQVFQLFFPNYNPDDSKPNSTKTGPRTDIGVPDNSIPKYAFDPTTGRPTLTLTQQITNPDTGKTSIVAVTYTNTPPIFVVTNAADVQASPTDVLGPHSFKLGDHVKVIDPDIGIAVFYDQAVPYVANSGLIIQTVGPASISSNTAYLLSPNLITLDRTTGIVTYDPEAFRFLGEGETAVYKFTFVSASGQDSAPQTLIFTVTGHNDAPVFAVNDTPLSFSETAHQTGQSTSHLVPIQLNFTDEDYSDVANSFTLSASVSTKVAGTHSTTPDLSKLPDSNALKSYLKIVADGADTNLGVSRTVLSDAGQVTAKFSAPDNVFDFLSEGEQVQIIYTIVVTDAHGASASQTITITVTGTNDAPVLTADDCVHVLKETRGATSDEGVLTLKTAGTLDFTDVDLNDVHSTTSPTTTASVAWQKSNGEGGSSSAGTVPSATLAALATALTTTLLTDSAHGATGHVGWSFALPDGFADFLAKGETLTVTYNVEVDDGHGGSSTQPVTVVITGTNDGPKAVADVNQGAAVVEAGNNVDGSPFTGNSLATGNVLANDTDVDINDTHCVIGVGAGEATGALHNGAGTITGKYGTLVLNADGSWTYTLDNKNPLTNALAQDERVNDVFSYTVSDNHGATSTTTLTIAITGSNDAPEANASPVAATDTNVGPAIVEAGVDAHGQPVFGVSQATGNVLTNDFDVDNGDTKAVQGVAAGTAAEPLSGGVDTVIVGTYGSVTIAADGSWTYLLDNKNPATQALAEGEHGCDVFTYTMRDAAGATSSATLTIDVTGTNDAPVATSSVENLFGDVTEDVTLKAVGQLTANDVDHDAALAWSIVGSNAGTYGSLAIDASSGQWTYTLANGTDGVAGLVQSLGAGEHYDETFTVRVTDNHGAWTEQTVTVTVHGTNDAPVVTVTNPDTVHESDTAAPVTVTIADHVSITDVDTSDAHVPYVADTLAFGSATGPVPGHGTLADLFTIDAVHGTVTYDRAAFDFLTAGQQVTATFNFDVSSGSDTVHQSITVTVDGVNDAPKINTDNVHISTSHGHTTVSGLSVSDVDGDHFTVTTISGHGSVSLPNGDYDTASINSALEDGVDYTRTDHSPVGVVAFKVTDDQGGSDSVNFIFRQGNYDGPLALAGTTQNDVLIGGAGRDYFIFSSGSGHDVVTNFNTAQDKIVLNGLTSVPSNEPHWFNEWVASGAIEQQGADTLIHLDGTDTVLLKNVNAAHLHANDFIIPHTV